MAARRPRRLIGRLVDAIEEGLMALLLAAALVATLYRLVAAGPSAASAGGFALGPYLFAALVLLGMSYGVRVNAHLGVDAFVKLLGAGPRRLCGLLAVTAGLAYAALLLAGAWEQVAAQYRLGGSDPIARWQLLAILPAGFALLLLRLAQAGVRIWRRQQESLLHADDAAQALRRHLASLAQAAADGPAAARPTRKRES